MKKLMMSTALVAATAFGSVAYADMHSHGSDAAMTTGDMMVPAFRVSDFTGKNLYALDSEATRAVSVERADETRSTWERTQLAWERSNLFAGERGDWENIGNIGDVVLGQDGAVRGILVDVGGFLGIGARTVMVEMDDLYFVADEAAPESISDFFVVATASREALEALPEFDDEQLRLGFSAANHSATAMESNAYAAQTDVIAPAMEADMSAGARTEIPAGYQVLPPQERTADRLMGADVYGREGESIATLQDVVIGANGEITHGVMDVGGFLGMGSHTVALELDDLDILWNDADGDVRVQVTMTKEELESLPAYEG